MAMRWLMSQPGLSARVDLREYMSGNLCRCTGYDGVIQGLRDVIVKSGHARKE
jgi:aerobic-type carbon monoxide dehydrogenase small subunit (CoxS/CutS family)